MNRHDNLRARLRQPGITLKTTARDLLAEAAAALDTLLKEVDDRDAALVRRKAEVKRLGAKCQSWKAQAAGANRKLTKLQRGEGLPTEYEQLRAKIESQREELRRKDGRIEKLEAALNETKERAKEAEAIVADESFCLVWSHEHGAWWRPQSAGYTVHAEAAGVYTLSEARLISHKGRDGWRPGQKPDELPVRLVDLPDWVRAAQKKDGRHG